MPRWLAFTLLGCGGSLGLLMILVTIGFVGCAALVASSGSESTSSQPVSKDSAVAIGEPVTVGDVVWTVTGAREAKSLEQQGVSRGKADKGHFVIIDFTFTNNGDKPLTLDNASLALIDSEGRMSNPSPDQSYYVPSDLQISIDNINPGITKHGQSIFKVAPSASGFLLQAGDTNMFKDENGYVNLGF